MTLITIITAAFVLIFLYLVQSRKKKRRIIDGIPQIPVYFMQVLKAASSGQLPQTLYKWSHEYGHDVFHIPPLLWKSGPLIVVGNPELARSILLKNNSSCSKPYTAYSRSENLHDGGTNFFSQNGERWSHAHKAIATAFSSQHIRRMTHVISEKTQTLEQKLETKSQEGTSFDVGKEMIHLTLSVICSAAFEYDMSTAEEEEFITESAIVLKENRNHSIPLRYKIGRLFIPAVKRSRIGSKRLYALSQRILASYRRLEHPIPGTVIDSIVNNTSYANDKERGADILLLLIAGYDTTAYSLAWTLLELAKNPTAQQRLQEELKDTSTHMDGHTQSQSEYLNQVIKESMRLNPVTPMSGIRSCTKDIVASYKNADIVIPKGTTMIFCNMITFLSVNNFDDPDTFLPSRWKDPSKKSLAAFYPFFLGKRSCVGRSLANAEIRTVLSRLCTKFKFSVENEGSAEFFLSYKPIDCRLHVKMME